MSWSLAQLFAQNLNQTSVQGQGEGGGCSPSPIFQVNIFMQFSGVNITHPPPHPKNPAAFKLTNRIWWICKSLVLFIFVARGKLVSFKTTYHEWKVRYHTLAATSFPLVFSGGIVQIVRLCKGYNETKIAMLVAKTMPCSVFPGANQNVVTPCENPARNLNLCPYYNSDDTSSRDPPDCFQLLSSNCEAQARFQSQ